MSHHYNYHGSSSNMQHPGQPQQLTPISSIPTHPYQQDSPGPSQILPPLQTAPNGQGLYAPEAYGNEANGARSGDQSAHPNLTSHPHMNIAEPQSSYGPIQPPLSSAPQTSSFATPARYSNAAAGDGQLGAYPHGDMFQFYERNGMPNGMQEYQNHPQMQNVQHQSHQQDQQRQGQDQTEARVMPVVGSQGRRGILPSASGQAPLPGSGPGTPRSNGTPSKNSDNKFPCLYCNKTYLHVKHLKRHHLRHTGERPYQCNLCYETFCRSDILKRHYQKCSIRRGNPTGATHLHNAQAHLSRPGPSTSASTGGNSQGLPPVNDGPTPNSGYQSVFSASSSSFHWSGAEPPPITRTAHPAGDSGRSTRSSSAMDRPDSGSGDDRRRFSSSNSLAPINGSFNPGQPGAQPSNGGPQHHRSGRQSLNGVQEPQVNGHASRDPYNQAMSAHQPPPMAVAGHPDQQHPQQYMRNVFPHAAPGAQMSQEEWANCFQPGAHQNTMMYPPQH